MAPVELFELAALGAATCWALSGLISSGPSQHLGALAFGRLRMAMTFVLLAALVAWEGSQATLSTDHLAILALSGLVGIFLGDTALFLTLNRMGPRRTSILFSMNAPMAAVLGWLVLEEALSWRAVAGIVVVMAGVVLAIVFGKRRAQLHQWESIKGPIWVGIMLGLTAALGQAVGSLLARPVMAAGVDPVAASAVRVGVAALALAAFMQLPMAAVKQRAPLTWPIAGWTLASGALAMGLGMTLILYALRNGEVGIVSTLSATTPVIILPMIWARTRERPAGGAWVGAALVVLGSWLLFGA